MDTTDVNDTIEEIKAVTKVLAFASKGLMREIPTNPDELYVGLSCLFDYVDQRLDLLADGVNELATAGRP